MRPLEGSLNPNWKGGHKSWQQGKLGRDKDGLSWKIQRQLAWDRDSLTCQDCQKKKEGWRPDVHHISPYRLSFSHALDNLKSLCRRCHKIAEAKIIELWGGKVLTPPKRTWRTGDWNCKSCGKKIHKEAGPRCSACEFEEVQLPQLKALRDKGLSYEKIAEESGMPSRTVWRWLNGKRWVHGQSAKTHPCHG